MFVNWCRRNGKTIFLTTKLMEELEELKNGRLYISQRTYDYFEKNMNKWLKDLKRKNIEIVIKDKKENKNMSKIEELENKMLEIAQEIAELKKGQNAGEWKPQEDDNYYCMGFNGKPFKTYFTMADEYDVWRVTNIPVFKTEEECQKYCNYRKALSEKSHKFSREEWHDKYCLKYLIRYHNIGGDFTVNSYKELQHIGAITFKTEEDAEYMINNYSEEMLKWGLL